MIPFPPPSFSANLASLVEPLPKRPIGFVCRVCPSPVRSVNQSLVCASPIFLWRSPSSNVSPHLVLAILWFHCLLLCTREAECRFSTAISLLIIFLRFLFTFRSFSGGVDGLIRRDSVCYEKERCFTECHSCMKDEWLIYWSTRHYWSSSGCICIKRGVFQILLFSSQRRERSNDWLVGWDGMGYTRMNKNYLKERNEWYGDCLWR